MNRKNKPTKLDVFIIGYLDFSILYLITLIGGSIAYVDKETGKIDKKSMLEDCKDAVKNGTSILEIL